MIPSNILFVKVSHVHFCKLWEYGWAIEIFVGSSEVTRPRLRAKSCCGRDRVLFRNRKESVGSTRS